MGSLINFQFGDVINSTPDWFDWLSLIINALLVVAGFAVAFCVYFTERNDNIEDTVVTFKDSLRILKEAVPETIKKLEGFATGLESSNDNFSNPGLSASLNDKLISKVDLGLLMSHYKKKDKGNIPKVRELLKMTGFFGGYHDYFINELNYFRQSFLSKEEKFKEYQLLLANTFFQVINQEHRPNSSDFASRYHALREQILNDREVIDRNRNVVNREALNAKFVIPLIEITALFISTDAMANSINQKANEINAARIDMNALKRSMAERVKKDIKQFNNLNGLLEALLK